VRGGSRRPCRAAPDAGTRPGGRGLPVTSSVVGVDPAAPRPDTGFRLHVPDDWLTLDLDPATSDAFVERVLDERVAEYPQAARHRGHMRRILQGLIAQQRDAGVFLAAVLAAGERPAELIGANLSLSWAKLDSPPGDIGWLARFFAEDEPQDGEDPDQREVDVVDLPAGPAVRVRTSLLAPIPETTRTQRVAVNQLVVPVRDTAWLALLVLSTPNLELAETFALLADEVAQSLAFLEKRPTGRIGHTG
jgi:hypothetical protein